MNEELTQRELNWIEGWIDSCDEGHEDPNAVEILRKMVATARSALQSAPPASEPRDNYGHCPKCEGTLQELKIVGCPACDTPGKELLDSAPEDRPYGDIPDEDVDLLYDNKWSLYDSDESADRPECSVCNDAPTTPFCSFCGQRPTQSDRPEPPLREGAMRAAEGCDSPHPDGDRPEPPSSTEGISEALERIRDGRDVPMPKNEEHARALAAVGLKYLEDSGLSQPAPAVPDIREALLGVYDGSIYIKDAEAQLRALAAQPSESPAVPDGNDPVVQVSGFSVANNPSTQCDYMLVGLTQSGKVIISRGDRDWADISPAAAPTPTDDEEQ